MHAPLVFAEEAGDLLNMDMEKMDLKGEYQRKNIRCAGAALSLLLENIAVPPGAVEKMYENIYNTVEGNKNIYKKENHTDKINYNDIFDVLEEQLYRELNCSINTY